MKTKKNNNDTKVQSKKFARFVYALMVLLMLAVAVFGFLMPDYLIDKQMDMHSKRELNDEIDTLSLTATEDNEREARIERLTTLVNAWGSNWQDPATYRSAAITFITVESRGMSVNDFDFSPYRNCTLTSNFSLQTSRFPSVNYFCTPKPDFLPEMYRGDPDGIRLYKLSENHNPSTGLTVWVDPETGAVIFITLYVDIKNFGINFRYPSNNSISAGEALLSYTADAVMVGSMIRNFADDNDVTLDYSSSAMNKYNGTPLTKRIVEVDDTQITTFRSHAENYKLYIFYERIYNRQTNKLTINMGFEPISEK